MTRPRLSFNPRIAVVVVHDIFMAAAAMELAIWVRYWLAGAPQGLFFLWEGTLLFTLVASVVFTATGLYRGIWHYASFRDLVAIVRAVALTVLIFIPILFLITRLDDVPRSVLVFVGPLLIVMLAGPRLLYRAWKDGNLRRSFERRTDPRVPVLLVGAGAPAETFIRAMSGQKHASYRVVGMVDDNPKRRGRDIHGVRVLGELSMIPDLVERLGRNGNRPQRLIIAARNLDGAKVEALLETADQLGLVLSRMPEITDFQRSGGDGMPPLRPIDVEDLLGRPQRVLDRTPLARLIQGRCVLVTGAGGTIGGELVRQIAALGPRRLVLFEASEHNLYQIDLELAERPEILSRRAVLGDVRDRRRLERIFAAERPDIVFHAAAFKHVPLVETNPNEAVLTNVVGTRTVAETCLAHGTGTMVLISTDKAVNPTNVMGASKRIAEMVIQTIGSDGETAGADDRTRFVAVRFGNVLGSTGSVVPLFQRQLARGGPLTVTHPDVTRFFMTVREAVELILQAAARPDLAPSRSGSVFVLDMGKPVRIADLARQMIRLSGRQPDKDVQIAFTGLRPGEKLHEEILHPEEQGRPTAVDGVLLGGPRSPDRATLWPLLDALGEAAAERDTAGMLEILRQLVPEFAGDPAVLGAEQAPRRPDRDPAAAGTRLAGE